MLFYRAPLGAALGVCLMKLYTYLFMIILHHQCSELAWKRWGAFPSSLEKLIPVGVNDTSEKVRLNIKGWKHWKKNISVWNKLFSRYWRALEVLHGCTNN